MKQVNKAINQINVAARQSASIVAACPLSALGCWRMSRCSWILLALSRFQRTGPAALIVGRRTNRKVAKTGMDDFVEV